MLITVFHSDGLVLLRLCDWLIPGCVDWKRAELKPNNKFKWISNCNLAVQVNTDKANTERKTDIS